MAETVAVLYRVGGLAFCDFFERGLAEVAPPVEFAAVEHHAAEKRRVLRRGKQTAGGHREAMRAIGERIDQLAHWEFFEVGFLLVRAVRFGHTRVLFLAEPERRILHPERFEQTLLHEVLILHPAHHFEDAGRCVDAGVGVLILRSGLGLERRHRVTAHRCGERESVERRLFDGGLKRHPAHVIERLANGDGMRRFL